VYLDEKPNLNNGNYLDSKTQLAIKATMDPVLIYSSNSKLIIILFTFQTQRKDENTIESKLVVVPRSVQISIGDDRTVGMVAIARSEPVTVKNSV